MTAMLGTFIMRFDLRAAAFGAPAADLYATALDMGAWGEDHGFSAVVVSEHHATDDGYLPSPLNVASTMVTGRVWTSSLSVASEERGFMPR